MDLCVSAMKAFKKTNDVRKEKGVNSKALEFITAQTDISLSEILDRLGVSYKTEQRAVVDLKRLALSKELEKEERGIGG